MQILEVTNQATKQLFLSLPPIIYKNDPVWVQPLNNDIEAVFDPAKNKFHDFGEVCRWVLLDDNHKIIGRVAAFINRKKAFLGAYPTGGMGFFECIDDQKAANVLFDTCKKWLIERGMKAMDGPINFGENDSWWGLLIDGFVHPSFGMQYNPPYYKALFENYGFIELYKQFTNVMKAPLALPERMERIAEQRIIKNPDYSFKHLTATNFDELVKDFTEVYNDAWKDFDHFEPITKDVIASTFNAMKPIADNKLIWFVYYKGVPVSFVIGIPDANQLIKYLHGKLNICGKIKFLYYRWKGVMNRIRVVVMGTKQGFQNRGLESALFLQLKYHVYSTHHYKEVELSWVGDFNQKMQAIHAILGAVREKTHATYQFIFTEK